MVAVPNQFKSEPQDNPSTPSTPWRDLSGCVERSVFTRASSSEQIKSELVCCMVEQLGRDPLFASKQDWFFALAYLLRGRLSASRIRTWRRNFDNDAKWICYLSLEFLPGRLLKMCLLSSGLYEACRDALAQFDVSLEELTRFEVEPALGNGGLGRLGACLLDALTTQGYAAIGYGIRYEYGMFRQELQHGEQVEHPENWLKSANPWEFSRPNVSCTVQFNGRVTQVDGPRRGTAFHWMQTDDVMAMAYDIPVLGFGTDAVSSIRLWSAAATEDFNLTYFNSGNYIEAVKEKSETETISRVLYPSDTTRMGRELRLKQEYFLVSASLQDILKRFHKKHDAIELLPDKVAIHLNDTHPALAIPELMRLLVDEYGLSWDQAWGMTVRTFAFTNHTLLSEALELWPVELFERVLPRHLQIIYEINHRFLRDIMHRCPGDADLLRRVSLVEENHPRSIRMAHLATVGSHKVNGVSRMHTTLMRKTVFKDFDDFFPERIISLTNGISQYRWLAVANPDLAKLISARTSDAWLSDPDRLRDLEPFAADAEFQSAFAAVKLKNKQRLAAIVKERHGATLDVNSMFDVHVKRIHEYKRQLLNILHVVARYNRIRHGNTRDMQPRTVIFAGKAAPGYTMAKQIVHLINSVADIVNNDPVVDGWLKVVFIPNYDVQTAEDVIPAGDLSQQISMAGTEASGTGNMKFALNGALTIATHDGANDEIAEAVGRDNIFTFGATYDELQALRQRGYDPVALYRSNSELREALDMIGGGYFSPDRANLFLPIYDSLLRHGDHYMLLADFAPYLQCQERVDATYADQREWLRRAIVNVANMGFFAADRLVREYAMAVWNAKPAAAPTTPAQARSAPA
jgi:glycogen phosphorylase